MLTAGYVLATLLAVGIVAIGLRFLIAPAGATAGYGISVAPARVFTDIKGVRDIASGLVLLPFVVSGHPVALATVLVAEAVTPLGDAVIVRRHGGSWAAALGIHAATVVVMLLTAALLLTAA